MAHFGLGFIAGLAQYNLANAALFASGSELSLTYSLNAPWTFSAWIKQDTLGVLRNLLGTNAEIRLNSGDTLTAEGLTTTALFRDVGDFMHVHVSDNGLYINGVSFGSVTTTNLSNAKLFDDFQGYVAEVHLKSGTDAYTNFGETTNNGDWVAISATAGEHYLKFSNGGNLGENSGSGSDWTATSVTQVTDTPTNNTATFNPLDVSIGDTHAHSNGNLTLTYAANSVGSKSTLSFDSGKYSAEFTATTNFSAEIGIIATDATESAGTWTGKMNMYAQTGKTLIDGTYSGSSPYATLAAGDTVRVEADADGNSVEFFKNDVSQGTQTMASGKRWCFGARKYDSGTLTIDLDSHTLSTGFNYLNEENFEPVTDDIDDMFSIVKWAGDNTSDRVVSTGLTSCEFSWVKVRNLTYKHILNDALRGAGILSTNLTDAEGASYGTNGGVDTTGGTGDITLKQGTAPGIEWVNESGYNYVAWCASLPSDETNSSGDITVTWKYNAVLGMAVGTYTGTGTAGNTIGLPNVTGNAPFKMVVKRRDGADNWPVYHKAAGSKYGLLNSTNAFTSTNAEFIWGNDSTFSAPTSSVATLGSSGSVNASGGTYVIIVFWETAFCKSVGYQSNSNVNGAMDTMNLSPVWWLGKSSSAVGAWGILDTARSPENPANEQLYPNWSNAEDTANAIDFLSNGAKQYSSTSWSNTGGSMLGVAIGIPIQATKAR